MDGFHFTCVPGCTNCCDQEGYVYVTEDDVRHAAEFLAIPIDEFERKYVYRTKYTLRFRKPANSQCHFLTNGGCRIHPVKPVQCRVFPYWPELIEDRQAWEATAGYCPGIGTGPLVQIGTALERSNEMRRAYPTMYDDAEQP